jgi:hypothetical protein
VPLNLKKSFTTGQGAGAANYVTYAPDLDFDFTAIENLVNQLESQLVGIQGPNVLLGLDILQSDDPATTPDELEGRIGAHSYIVTINASPALLNVSTGVALVDDKRVELVASAIGLVGPGGGASTHYVALDINGVPSIKTSAGQGAADIARATWNGTIYTAISQWPTVTDVIPVFFDGDDYADQQTVVGHATVGVGVQTHTKVANRFENVERALRGHTANVVAGGPALGPVALIRGTAAAPGLIQTAGDGVTFDTGTGLFRQALNAIGFATAGVERARLNASGQLLMQAGTDALPAYAFLADPDTGMFSSGGGVFSITIDGTATFGFGPAGFTIVTAGSAAVPALKFGGTDIDGFFFGTDFVAVTTSGVERARFGLNTLASPAIGIAGDANTGFRQSAADTINVVTGGVEAVQYNPQQQQISSTFHRVKALRTATQSITSADVDTDGNLVAVNLTAADVFDVGGLHDPVTNPDRVTVQTGGAGLYYLQGDVRWAVAANAGERRAALTLNGATTVIEGASVIRNSVSLTDECHMQVSCVAVLAATDIVRLSVAQEDSVAAAVDVLRASLTAVKLW